MVGTCVSTVGVAISDVVLTRAGGVQRRLESSLSCDVGTSALQLRPIVPMSVNSDQVRSRLRCSTHYLTLTVLVYDPKLTGSPGCSFGKSRALCR